ncbi:MAG: transposase [Actinomycetota bacterium]
MRKALPAALVVAGKFHVIRQASGAVEAVRGRKDRVLPQRHRLLKGRQSLTLADLDELALSLPASPSCGGLGAAERPRRVYTARSPQEAEERLDA